MKTAAAMTTRSKRRCFQKWRYLREQINRRLRDPIQSVLLSKFVANVLVYEKIDAEMANVNLLRYSLDCFFFLAQKKETKKRLTKSEQKKIITMTRQNCEKKKDFSILRYFLLCKMVRKTCLSSLLCSAVYKWNLLK